MADNISYLITGGCRSGKSRHALELSNRAKRPYYIATGWAGDAEMQDRIDKHQAERGPHWSTIETKINIVEAIIEAESAEADYILVDCLTLWTSNLMFDESENLMDRLDELAEFIPKVNTPLIFVTNEVGSGIVPGDKLSREYRDNAGWVNQRVASVVDRVIMSVSGIPVQIKP